MRAGLTVFALSLINYIIKLQFEKNATKKELDKIQNRLEDIELKKTNDKQSN